MTEENVTKTILKWLNSGRWQIICFDFPQSGTGVILHPNNRESKNKGAFIPDIVAEKNGSVVFFENKDRFVLADFIKIDELRKTKDYSDSITALLNGIEYKDIYYGAGLGDSEIAKTKVDENISKVDFVVFCSESGVSAYFDPNGLY